jgi:hypothetical protein
MFWALARRSLDVDWFEYFGQSGAWAIRSTAATAKIGFLTFVTRHGWPWSRCCAKYYAGIQENARTRR